MPTPEWFAENPKISAYVSKDIDDALKAWMEENRIKKVSAALTTILEQFLGLADAPTGVAPGNYATLEQLQELQARVEALEKSSSPKKTKSKSTQKSTTASRQKAEATQQLDLEDASDSEWMTTKEAYEQYVTGVKLKTFGQMSPDKMKALGLEADPSRKRGRGKNATPWIRKI